MIEELTNEQKALLEVYKDKWLNIGLSTNDFSFEEAKEISDYYYEKILNITKVPVIIMDSPYTAWIAVCLLSKDQVRSQVWSQVWDFIYPYLDGSFNASYFSFYNYMKEVLNFDFGEKQEQFYRTILFNYLLRSAKNAINN